MPTKYIVIAIVAGGLCVTDLAAQEETNDWGISPYIGLYQPKLTDLIHGAFQAPFLGQADFIDPTSQNTTGTFNYQSPLPPFNPGTLAGLEASWRINDKNALILGVGTWEAVSSVASVGNLPIEGNLERTDMLRKADFTFNELYLGWRYNLHDRPGKYRLYFTGTLHQVFDLDYREDWTNVFLSGDVRTFRKTTMITAQATGLALLEGSVGGEWFFTDWFSLGIEAGYRYAPSDIELSQGEIHTDVLATDNLSVQYPLRNGNSGRIEYNARPGTGAPGYDPLKLDFSGWMSVFKATVYF
jgi:hypothetical protein